MPLYKITFETKDSREKEKKQQKKKQQKKNSEKNAKIDEIWNE